MIISGLNAKDFHVHKVSDNLTRLVITTKNDNGYAIYHYKDDGKMFANWKRGFIVGDEKKDILLLMGIN
jgi:hypothetical protein